MTGPMREYTGWVKDALVESEIATPEQAEAFYRAVENIGTTSDRRSIEDMYVKPAAAWKALPWYKRFWLTATLRDNYGRYYGR